MGREGRDLAYVISGEPDPLESIGRHHEPRPAEFLGHGDVKLHVHEGDRQYGPVLLEPADQAFGALRHEQEPLAADFGQGGDGALDLLLGEQLQLAACFRTARLRDDVDDGEDVDPANGREILAPDHHRTHRDELLASVRVLRRLECHGFDAHDHFARIEIVSVRGLN